MSNSQFDCLNLCECLCFIPTPLISTHRIETNRIEEQRSCIYKIQCKMLNANLKCHRQLLLSFFFFQKRKTFVVQCRNYFSTFSLLNHQIRKTMEKYLFLFQNAAIKRILIGKSFKPNWNGMKRRKNIGQKFENSLVVPRRSTHESHKI